MDSEGREMLSKEDSAAIGALITEATGKFFVALRGSSRAVYPVKIEVVSGNGSILTGLLLDSDAEAVFGDASKSEMTFPLSLTATDNTGRVFVSMKLPQPTPAVADEGQPRPDQGTIGPVIGPLRGASRRDRPGCTLVDPGAEQGDLFGTQARSFGRHAAEA